jgi:REP element-mobilizing transposase RayT
MSQFEYQQYYDRNLPHIQPPEATLFVTFRLDGSLPQSALEEWRADKRKLEAERLRREAIGGAPLDPEVVAEEKLDFQRRWFGKFEDLLHGEKVGPVWLKDERVAKIVADALHYRDGKVYLLFAYCIMPNHVHTVFAPLLTEELARKLAEKARLRAKDGKRKAQTDDEDDDPVLAVIMQSLKGYTARKCNLALGRSGQFWQHESYDHVVRVAQEWDKTIKYVMNNPVKAGLVEEWQDWKWSYLRQDQSKENSEPEQG